MLPLRSALAYVALLSAILASLPGMTYLGAAAAGATVLLGWQDMRNVPRVVFVVALAMFVFALGYDPELIDLISLKPFDIDAIKRSIAKTHRVVIVEECMKTGGIGAELIALITEHCFDELDAPPVRLSSQDIPTPYNGKLENLTIIQPHQIVESVQQLVQR